MMANYMSINSFVSKIFINIRRNIKLYLQFATTVALFYSYLFIVILVIATFNKRPDPLFDYLKTLNYKILISSLLILSIFLTSLIYVFANLKAQKANPIEKIHQYLKRSYNYYPILPLFMISIGFLLTTFFIFDSLFSTLGIMLFFFGIFLFYIMLLIKTNCESKIFFTLHKASEILNDIDFDNNKSRSIKEFNKYFIKFLNNIDINLKKGIKINDVIKEDTPTINFPVKSAIIYYLPVFMKFGSEEQICSLKNHINQMLTLVKENDEFELTVSEIILDIYKNIEDFLHANKYSVTEQRQGLSLSILRDRDFQTIIFGTFQSVVSIIIIVLTRK